MHCLTVTYPTPKDAGRFRSYYESTHVPLAKQLPGLRSCCFAYPAPLGPGAAPFCIFHAYFADEAAMMAALQSAIGQKVARTFRIIRLTVPHFFTSPSENN
jgi:uncharacterized protein (TIGR02118 family)